MYAVVHIIAIAYSIAIVSPAFTIQYSPQNNILQTVDIKGYIADYISN